MTKTALLLNWIEFKGRVSLGELCLWKKENFLDSAQRRLREHNKQVKCYREGGNIFYEWIGAGGVSVRTLEPPKGTSTQTHRDEPALKFEANGQGVML